MQVEAAETVRPGRWIRTGDFGCRLFADWNVAYSV